MGSILDLVRHTTKTAADPTFQCVTPGAWSECGRIPLDVPAGHTYTVTIWSSVTAATAVGSQSAYSCPAITGPTCIDGRAEYIRFIPNMETNVASSATVNLGAGHYDLSTAVLFPNAIMNEQNVNAITTVEYYDAGV